MFLGVPVCLCGALPIPDMNVLIRMSGMCVLGSPYNVGVFG